MRHSAARWQYRQALAGSGASRASPCRVLARQRRQPPAPGVQQLVPGRVLLGPASLHRTASVRGKTRRRARGRGNRCRPCGRGRTRRRDTCSGPIASAYSGSCGKRRPLAEPGGRLGIAAGLVVDDREAAVAETVHPVDAQRECTPPMLDRVRLLDRLDRERRALRIGREQFEHPRFEPALSISSRRRITPRVSRCAAAVSHGDARCASIARSSSASARQCRCVAQFAPDPRAARRARARRARRPRRRAPVPRARAHRAGIRPARGTGTRTAVRAAGRRLVPTSPASSGGIAAVDQRFESRSRVERAARRDSAGHDSGTSPRGNAAQQCARQQRRSSSNCGTLRITSCRAAAAAVRSVRRASPPTISAVAPGIRCRACHSRGRNGSGIAGAGQRARRARRPRARRNSCRAQVAGSMTVNGARSSCGSNSVPCAMSRSSDAAVASRHRADVHRRWRRIRPSSAPALPAWCSALSRSVTRPADGVQQFEQQSRPPARQCAPAASPAPVRCLPRASARVAGTGGRPRAAPALQDRGPAPHCAGCARRVRARA